MKIDYKELFTDRVIYITGVGRSGTTIMGKIFSSMRPVYYLFEPAILRAPITHNKIDILRRNIFEDYFLNQIHGRSNPNPHDWTHWSNHIRAFDLLWKWDNLKRRDDAIALIEKEKPLWVIKNPEAQPIQSQLEVVFPGIRFINIVRHGLDVVINHVERGWFTDTYQPIEPVNEHGMPWYIPDHLKVTWRMWNQETRAACNWRILTELFPYDMKYENFCKFPDHHIKSFSEEFNLGITNLTKKHIADVKVFPSDKTERRRVLNLIIGEEKIRFKRTMEKVGYELF